MLWIILAYFYIFYKNKIWKIEYLQYTHYISILEVIFKLGDILFPNTTNMKIYVSFKNNEGEIFAFSYTKPKKGFDNSPKEKKKA